MNSQGPMLNPLTMKCFNKRSGDDMDGTCNSVACSHGQFYH